MATQAFANGADKARRAADARESAASKVLEVKNNNVNELKNSGHTILTSDLKYTPDNFVDQLNNATARQLAIDHPGASPLELASRTLDLMKPGHNGNGPQIYTFATDAKTGNSTVTPTTLSLDQYNRSKEKLFQTR